MGANECLFAISAMVELRVVGSNLGDLRMRVWRSDQY